MTLASAVRHEGAAVTPAIWRVVFLPRKLRNWWDLFSPFGFRHCVAYAYCVASDAWLIFDPADDYLLLTSIPSGSTFHKLNADYFAAASLILEVERCEGGVFQHRVGQWCSSQIARLLGVRGSAWRPYALAKTLIANGALVIHKAESDEFESEGSEGRSGDEASSGD